MTKKFDLFISHASEDKDVLVRPLAEALSHFGVRVWYDEFTLKLGDSLSRSIDHGLVDSEFGLVVLSPSFLTKGWPEYELRGLTAKEIGGRKAILPVWHNITREDLLRYSPSLADKLALKSHGTTAVKLACAIIDVVRPDLSEKILRRVAQSKAKTERKTLDVKTVKFGPPKHDELPLNLISRIRLVRAALFGVCPHSMPHWIDGFRADTHPSREVRIWEHIAACYLEYCAMKPLTRPQREQVYKVLAVMSLGVDSEDLNTRCQGLPDDALEVLEEIWRHPVPAFDIDDEPFPVDYDISADHEESLKAMDREHFPFDVPDELIAEMVRVDHDDAKGEA